MNEPGLYLAKNKDSVTNVEIAIIEKEWNQYTNNHRKRRKEGRQKESKENEEGSGKERDNDKMESNRLKSP